MNKIALLISCEHAVNTIPNAYRYLFNSCTNMLESHRGFDLGALEIALHFKDVFSCHLIQAETSRLLIDYNRSLTKRCFSEITKNLPTPIKQEIISQYYLPYRQRVVEQIDNCLLHAHQVMHCSIHSFTPVLNKVRRDAEIGFLYDPQRALEKELAKKWGREIKKQTPQYKIRMNYPYKGISDGLTTALRKKYSPDNYLGIEIEINQALIYNLDSMTHLKRNLATSLFNLLNR